MKLLHVLPTIDPSGGGPMESVLRGGLQCVRWGHDIEVATLDDPASPMSRGYPLPLHALGPSRAGYGYARRFVPWLRQAAPSFDAVVVHGLWQYHGLGAWLALHRGAVPYFVFAHGMLDPWFRRAYPLKHIKKQLYWPLADYRLLRDAAAVLFTCEEERRLARDSFRPYRVRERVVAFGTEGPSGDPGRLREAFLEAHPALAGKRLVLFLGRLHPKKGCDLLLDAFAKVAHLDTSLHLVVAGPDSTGWLGTLQAQARSCGVADRVTFAGMLQGERKWGALHAAEVFVLPSHQENFGIAVAEALACERPVLVSDKVNIWREIVAGGGGFAADDTASGTQNNLMTWLSLDAGQRLAVSQRARTVFERHFTIQAMAQSLLDVVAGHRRARGPLSPRLEGTC